MHSENYISELKLMTVLESIDVDTPSVPPTRRNQLVAKLEKHLLEWRDKWEKVLRDAKIASAKDEVIRFDADIMADWKIISAYQKCCLAAQ